MRVNKTDSTNILSGSPTGKKLDFSFPDSSWAILSADKILQPMVPDPGYILSTSLDLPDIDVPSLRAENERLKSENRTLKNENQRYAETLPQMAANVCAIKEDLRNKIAAKEDVERCSERIIGELRGNQRELTLRIGELYDLAKASSIRRRAQRSAIIALALSGSILLLITIFGPLSVNAPIARGFVVLSIAFLIMAWCLPEMNDLGTRD